MVAKKFLWLFYINNKQYSLLIKQIVEIVLTFSLFVIKLLHGKKISRFPDSFDEKGPADAVVERKVVDLTSRLSLIWEKGTVR